jgi:hypothetical protein
LASGFSGARLYYEMVCDAKYERFYPQFTRAAIEAFSITRIT